MSDETKSIEALLKCKEDIAAKFPERHKSHVFWCPKNKDADINKPGFFLYAYGGQVLQLYIDNDTLHFSFNYSYDDYYEGHEGNPEIKRIKEIHVPKTRLESLKKLDKTQWGQVFSAFENRAYSGKNGKMYLERCRETVIAHNNSDVSDEGIKIIEMESRIPKEIFPDKKPKKTDFVGVRINNGKPVLSFIEYKCTTGAMDGNQKPINHFIDMKEYYTKKEVFRYFEGFDKRIGKPVLGSVDDADREMIFLFSHVGAKKDGMTIQKAINGIKEIEKKANKTDNVKIVIIDDENRLIKNEDIISIGAALKKLEHEKKTGTMQETES